VARRQRRRLLRSGLERIARLAGLTLVEAGSEARITLHSGNPIEAPSPSALDVTAEGDLVTVTVQGIPDQATWSSVLALLRQLLEPAPLPPNAGGVQFEEQR
jgi:hypothetical protein